MDLVGERAGFRLVAAVAVATVAALAALAPTSAGADTAEPRNVVASGRAQGFRATYTVPDYVIVSEFFDGGGPVTDAVVDSTRDDLTDGADHRAHHRDA